LASEAHGSENADIVVAIQLLADIVQGQAGTKLDTIDTQIQLCVDEIKALRSELPQDREKSLLRWLNFRQISWRYEEVPLAYQKTFEWVLQRPHPDDDWDNFQSYLTTTDAANPYFVNGKAGSGKSTLMKFLAKHPMTMNALSKWAGTHELYVATFFFWNLGTPLQRSRTGMLRALIYSILERFPELIPAVLPSLYQNWKQSEAESEPTYIEMKNALDLITQKSSSFLRLCIFIDGIDEFDGDHKDISLFLRSLASPYVKLIVSSRPVNACLNAFQGCPTLRLQDLTRNDMELFVQGELASHTLMRGLTHRFPQDAAQLVSEIKDKADGVFLWVKLVVRMLVDGLEAGDDMKDLQEILRSLPSDLRYLYQRMFESMQPEYRRQASEIFQLHQIWNTFIIDQPLRALILSYAIEPPLGAFALPIAPLNRDTFHWRTQHIEARIRSRCCGLLELHIKCYLGGFRATHGNLSGLAIPVEMSNGPAVGYLHRTVAEFLASEGVWDIICAPTKNSVFDPVLNLTCACLSVMKLCNNFNDRALELCLNHAVVLCRNAIKMSEEMLKQCIQSIDQIMREHKTKTSTNIFNSPDSELHWSTNLQDLDTDPITRKRCRELASISTFAAVNGLVKYLKATCNRNSDEFLSRYAMAIYAMESRKHSRRTGQPYLATLPVSHRERRDTLLFLLGNVIPPESEAFGSSLWKQAIILSRKLRIETRLLDSAELMRIFLSATKITSVPIESGIRSECSFLLRAISGNEDPGLRKLGAEIEQLAFPFLHSPGVIPRANAINESEWNFGEAPGLEHSSHWGSMSPRLLSTQSPPYTAFSRPGKISNLAIISDLTETTPFHALQRHPNLEVSNMSSFNSTYPSVGAYPSGIFECYNIPEQFSSNFRYPPIQAQRPVQTSMNLVEVNQRFASVHQSQNRNNKPKKPTAGGIHKTWKAKSTRRVPDHVIDLTSRSTLPNQ
jgi:hypothetical protein